MRQFFTNLSKKQKIMLETILGIIVFAIIAGVIFAVINKPRIVVIQNLDQYMSSVNGREKFVLQRNLYLFMTRFFGDDIDPNDIFIREGTYAEVSNNGHNAASFIIDIDSLKISYDISFIFPSEGLTFVNPIINCPILSEVKFPDTECVGMDNSTELLKAEQANPINAYLPIIVKEIDSKTKLPVHYEIRGFFDAEDNYSFVVNIVDYTSGNYENALNDIREIGFDPSKYTIHYFDESVYRYLPYEGVNSLDNPFTIDYTYTQDGAPFFLINNYSCGSESKTEQSTTKAVEDWFLSHGNVLSDYQYGVLTFCQQ